jgi:hypothetical protein
MASTMGVKRREAIRDFTTKFGKTIVSKVSKYEVKNLELQFYYLSDNYENKLDNYRAIPRLVFKSGKPGGSFGMIGTLNLVPNGGAP